MSVVVRGMEMPRECRDCRFESFHSDIGQTYCSANLKVLATAFEPIAFEGRHKDCPLFEIKDWKDL